MGISAPTEFPGCKKGLCNTRGYDMQTQIRLSRDSSIRTYGMRASAIPYRTEIERSLSSGESVVIDFAGNDVTQSFVDELIGALILKEGRQVVSRLAFENCTNDVKGIIKFVVHDRVRQLQKIPE